MPTATINVRVQDGAEINAASTPDATINVAIGAPGPAGPAGGGAGANYLHTQASASAIWTVNHNLGARPTIEVRNNGGQVVLAEITHVSANQATITLVAAMSGTAFCTI